MTDDLLWLVGIAWRLDRLRWTPGPLLSDLVTERGACMRVHPAAEPGWLREARTDRELAERLCAGCPVPDECVELELRTAAENTVGVWGGLTEDDRRELHWHWRQRGDRADDVVESDGGRSL